MKRKYTLFIALLLISMMSYANGNLTVKQQLESLNACWKDKNFTDPFYSKTNTLSGEVFLIRTHLFLVEKNLREAKTENLTPEQRNNRNYCLDVLHAYWNRGVFPKNLYHAKRTPYFIDDYGTACAVGQLIVSTGYGNLASQISKENNYAYIKELNAKYPSIKMWADKYGFTIDELAWIQPGYAICDTACTYSLGIYATGGQQPYSYAWNNGATSDYINNLCPGNMYTCIVTDALGMSIPSDSCTIGFQATMVIGNSYYLPEAAGIYVDATSTPDYGTCNGTATASVTGASSGINYYWSPGGETTENISGLCAGTYTIMVSNTSGCYGYKSVDVTLPTGLDEFNESSVAVYPNPVSDVLTISLLNKSISSKHKLVIYNTLKKVVYEKQLTDISANIDISFLDRGTYFVSIDNPEGTIRKKIIKN